MKDEKNYVLLDWLKFLCAFLVIGIHTRPFLTINEIMDSIFA